MTNSARRTALITGCSRGVGLDVSRALRSAGGYALYGLSRSHPEPARGDPEIEVVLCDLADPGATAAAAERVLELSGGIDVLVSNAGIGIFRPVDELRLEEWQRVLAVDLTAPFVLLNRLLPGMKERNFGRIVLISSDASERSFADASAYCAAKAGAAMLARCVRKEVQGYSIHVTTITPGRIDTYFNDKRPGDREHSLQPAEVAAQVAVAIAQPDRCEIEDISLNSALEKALH